MAALVDERWSPASQAQLLVERVEVKGREVVVRLKPPSN